MFRDYTNYDVLPSGRIWSKSHKKFLKPYTMKNGYQMVSLFDNEGKQHKQYVHRVCWIAVNGREVPEGMELDHIDSNKKNNHISNLRLCTHQENCNFGTRNARIANALKGKINHSPKRVGAFKNGELQMVFESINEAHRQGYDQSNVWACCNGKRKTHKGYEWKYLDEEQ